MTRFARAKGSKSCNVKQPEDPTSWAEMKQAMQAQYAKKEDYASARNALDSVKNQRKSENKPAVWGTLGHGTDGDATDALGFLKSQLKKRKENNGNVKDIGMVKNGKVDDSKKKTKKSESVNPEKKSKKVKAKKKEVEVAELNGNGEIKKSKKRKADVSNDELIKIIENGVNEEKPKKKKKAKKNKVEGETIEENKNNGLNGDVISEKKGKKRKVNVEENLENEAKTNEEVPVKKKKKKSKKKKDSNNLPDENSNNTPKKTQKRKANDSENGSPDEKKKKISPNNPENDNNPNIKSKNFLKRQIRKNKFEQMKLKRNQKREKLKDLSPNERRRKPVPETQEAFINGENVKLQMFDGFWVTQEDAERLTKLKNDMLSKSIPLKDINGAIKLERRRAEKALARLKKRVCFQCRKFGHELSECPEIIESHNKASNVCYKCGSTEHTAYVCKVSHGDQFRFAECFICKEQGHISKQCPDNPRGLYPKGGACNVCGDVTHLKKDCPRLMTQKEESAVTAGIRDDRMIEDLDEHLVESKSDVGKSIVKKNKHIKF